LLLASLRKRVLGRQVVERDIARIVTQIAPLVAHAARQPEVEPALRLIAQDYGWTLEEARARWIALHEADLLLESGGDPEIVSSAEAVGVAQWIASTAQENGLSIRLAESRRLTPQIQRLRWKVAWMEYTLAHPEENAPLPGAFRLSRAEAARQLPGMKAALERLRAQRRKADPRYDPEKALFAQARYLLRLYRRVPSLDWVFQAYHGGVGGVGRTLRTYLGSAWPGSIAEAIRTGNHGRKLSFEHLYQTTSPTSYPACFAYLYGRSDDHRHYWWKLRVAQEGIALHRRDPGEFRRQWQALQPGLPKELLWYPDAPAHAWNDLNALRSALTKGELLARLEPDTGYTLPAPKPGAWSEMPALRPEARGALRLVLQIFRQSGGTAQLALGHLAVSKQEMDRWKASERTRLKIRAPSAADMRMPPDPATTIVRRDDPRLNFELHTVGLAFDILLPADPQQRKILDYALGVLEDREILWRIQEKELGAPRYHIVPNPRYAASLRGR
jgi:hypothetical protein